MKNGMESNLGVPARVAGPGATELATGPWVTRHWLVQGPKSSAAPIACFRKARKVAHDNEPETRRACSEPGTSGASIEGLFTKCGAEELSHWSNFELREWDEQGKPSAVPQRQHMR